MIDLSNYKKLSEKKISDMKPGEYAYTTYWGFSIDQNNNLVIYKNNIVLPEKRGTVNALVVCDYNGFFLTENETLENNLSSWNETKYGYIGNDGKSITVVNHPELFYDVEVF